MTLWHLLAEVTLAELAAIGLCCTQRDCDEIAIAVVHWPSGDTRCCDRHVAGWFRVAEAMGLRNLQTTPLSVRRFDVAPDDAARQRVEMLEFV